MGYMDREQSLKKLENQKRVLEYFDAHGGTIASIAQALGLSKSSVQRYLSDVDSVSDLKLIKEYLQANKDDGRSRGGRNSGFSKDKSGRFTGSAKKGK